VCRRLAKAARREAVDRVFDNGGFDAGQPGSRFVADHIVASDQRQWHAVVAGQRGVKARLAGWFAVDAYVPQRVRPGERVAEDATAVRGASVVADAEDRVERGVDAFDHQATTVFVAADEFGARIERVPQQVEHAVVGVGDDHFGGAGLERTTDRGVGVGRHPRPGALVVVALACARRPAGGRLAARRYAGDSFHIDRDQNLHLRSPRLSLELIQQLHRGLTPRHQHGVHRAPMLEVERQGRVFECLLGALHVVDFDRVHQHGTVERVQQIGCFVAHAFLFERLPDLVRTSHQLLHPGPQSVNLSVPDLAELYSQHTPERTRSAGVWAG
jgi:hypothetical protein